MLENPHSYRTVIHGEPSFIVSTACGTAGKDKQKERISVQQSQLAKPYKESFYQCISMAAKTSDSVVPENRNNVLVLQENLYHSLNWSNYIPRKGSRRDRKMCCTFSEVPAKQLMRFRISLDGSWMFSCKFIIFKVGLCLTLPKPHNPFTALTERNLCTSHC